MSKIVFITFRHINGLENNQEFSIDMVGVATVFNVDTQMLSIGVAFKSELDEFDRKKGSTLAVSRALEMPIFNSKLDISKFGDNKKLFKKFLKKWHQESVFTVARNPLKTFELLMGLKAESQELCMQAEAFIREMQDNAAAKEENVNISQDNSQQ